MYDKNPYASPVTEDLDVNLTPINESGYTLASAGSRLGAFLLECLFYLVPILLVAFLAIGLAIASEEPSLGVGEEQALSILIIVMPIFIIYMFIYLIINIVLLVKNGQTIGKKILGIKIVREGSHERAGFWRIFGLRYFVNGLCQGFSGLIPGGDFIYFVIDSCMVFRDDRQCLHDKIADTVVVNCR